MRRKSDRNGHIEETRMRRKYGRDLLLLGAAFALVGCGSDSTGVTGESAAGSYTAISFVTSGSSGQTNQIAAGSTLALNLATNGNTSGHLHIAATNTDPAFDADLAGTWQQQGTTVTFKQAADTFVNDMSFTLVNDPANGWTLVGDQTFSGTNVKITLKRAT
jgi:hypothetical protein